MAKDIYDYHQSAFSTVSAWVVLDNKSKGRGNLAAKVSIKRASCPTAYVQFLGLSMQRATAKGYGYDRDSAAVEAATRKIALPDAFEESKYWDVDLLDRYNRFKTAIREAHGAHWYHALERKGFSVIQAV